MILKLPIVCLILSTCKIEAKVENNVAMEQRVSILTENDKVATKFASNDSAIPSVRQTEALLNYTCSEQTDLQSYNKAQAAINNIKNCFSDLIIYAQLPSEISKNKLTGNLDTVFKRYCEHAKEKQTCVVDFLYDVEVCLPNRQRASKDVLEKIAKVVLKFVCENEGDHIALFISEKGLECIVDQSDNIQKCLITGLNLTSRYDDENFIDESQPQFEIDDLNSNNCKIAYGIRKCILRHLANCSGSTPVNVIEAMFTLVQNATSCRNFTICDWDPHDKSCYKDTQKYAFTIFISLVGISFVFLCFLFVFLCK